VPLGRGDAAKDLLVFLRGDPFVTPWGGVWGPSASPPSRPPPFLLYHRRTKARERRLILWILVVVVGGGYEGVCVRAHTHMKERKGQVRKEHLNERGRLIGIETQNVFSF